MSEDESFDDHKFDDHRDVRARLAAESSPVMPADVADRLHARLVEEAEGRPDPTVATVTPIRRRGRWQAPLLTAAAVVAVIAIAVPIVNRDSDDAASSDSGSSGAFSGNDFAGPSAGAPAPSGGQPSMDGRKESDGQLAPTTEPRLTRDDFAADVKRELVEADALPPTTHSGPRTAVKCTGDVPSRPSSVPATLDGVPALILATRSTGVVAGVEITAIVCGPEGPKVSARTTLPD